MLKKFTYNIFYYYEKLTIFMQKRRLGGGKERENGSNE
jgi:hypothetical protein